MHQNNFFVGFFSGMVFMFLALLAIGTLIDRGHLEFTPNVQVLE